MAECKHIRQYLSPYTDGELPTDKHQQVDDHLQDCEECSVLVSELQELGSAITNTSIPGVPANLAEKISDAALKELNDPAFRVIPGGKVSFSPLQKLGIAASLVVSMLTGLLLGLGTAEDSTTANVGSEPVQSVISTLYELDAFGVSMKKSLPSVYIEIFCSGNTAGDK